MSANNDNVTFNDRECDYEYFGDTRNNPKHNEEKQYSKNSYNYKIYKKIKYSKMKKLNQKEKYAREKEKNEEELKESNEKKEDDNILKSYKKRILKKTNEENENYGNKCNIR